MHWQQKEQNFKGTRPENNSERNAVMVRGRQSEELSPCSPTAPLLFSHHFFVLNNKIAKEKKHRKNESSSIDDSDDDALSR